MDQYDIAVIGGGMTGAAMALGLAKQGKSVALVENTQPRTYDPQQEMDLRVSAISLRSVALLEQLGAWSYIESQRLCPYRRLETWESPGCRTRFHSDDIGEPHLGYMVENILIQDGLWQAFSTYPNLTVFCPDKLASLSYCHDQVEIGLDSGDAFKAAWVIGADGAQSKVRQWSNIGSTDWDYRQRCMLIHVATELPQQDITWQQFTPNGPRSFLPLPGQQASLVWYDSPERIQQLCSMSASALQREIGAEFPDELGEVSVIKWGSFPLTRRHAQRYWRHRAVLIGDSAHTINPLAGQGVNLGFKDVEVLLALCEEQGMTEQSVQQYQARRRPDNMVMQAGMDVFYTVFSNTLSPLKLLRNSVLLAAEHSGPIKNKVLRYAIGLD